MLHALRVAWTFFKIGLLNEFAYRANLYLQLLQSGVAVGAALGGLLVVFGHTDSLGGWGQDEILAVLGVYLLMSAAMGGVIEPSMARLMEDVRQGTLDYTLTKPVEAQFLISISDIRVWKLVDVALGVIVLVVALVRRGEAVGVADSAGFALMLLADRHLPAMAALHPHLHRAGGDRRHRAGRGGGRPAHCRTGGAGAGGGAVHAGRVARVVAPRPQALLRRLRVTGNTGNGVRLSRGAAARHNASRDD